MTLVLITYGYCRKDDKDQDGEDLVAKDHWAAGTGMGEGEGVKDISDQIEDENMMDGYQNEQVHEGNEKKEEQGEGMDVSFDVEGDLENKQVDNIEKEEEEDGQKKGTCGSLTLDV